MWNKNCSKIYNYIYAINFMLYHLNEFKKAALWPAHMWSEMATSLLDPLEKGHGSSYGQLFKASANMVERGTRVYAKPKFDIQGIQRDGHTLVIQEKSIATKPFCSLLGFQRKCARKKNPNTLKNDPVVLVVAPLSGHFATLLRDTVRAMIPFHQTYITDWVDARTVPLRDGDFTLDHYVDYLLDFIRTLSNRHGRRIHLIAVCQPAVPVLMATSLMALYKEPWQPLSMTLMGGPIDTRVNPGKVNAFCKEHDMNWFRRHVISEVPSYYPGAGRKVCPGFVLLSGFMNLNPGRHHEASSKLFQHLVQGDMEEVEAHNRFYDEYRAVMDVPGNYFLDSIDHAFQRYSLPKGEMMWRGYPIHPEVIEKTGLMTVEGQLDDISCVGQTMAAHDLCSSLSKERKMSLTQEKVGHYGIFSGRRWRTMIQPHIAAFMREQEKFADEMI